MFKNRLLFILFFQFIIPGLLQAQVIRKLTTFIPVSIRGLSAVNEKVIWVSGTEGTIGLSKDGGKTWKQIQVNHYEKTDFRDIEAYSDQEAVIMGTTEPAVILRTTDGGQNWKTVFEDSSKSIFLDAMDFSGVRGAVVGDPDAGKIFFAVTSDSGKTWSRKDAPDFDGTEKGESFFAASGSNLSVQTVIHDNGYNYSLVSGGKKSCIYFSLGPEKPVGRHPLLINQGKESAGANSIAINPWKPNQAFVVGGDYSLDSLFYRNSVLIQLNPFKQESPANPPHGYRSCVEWLDEKQIICCGTTGVDYSADGGIHWTLISNESFHVCRRAKYGHALFLAGVRGRISRLDWKEAKVK